VNGSKLNLHFSSVPTRVCHGGDLHSRVACCGEKSLNFPSVETLNLCLPYRMSIQNIWILNCVVWSANYGDFVTMRNWSCKGGYQCLLLRISMFTAANINVYCCGYQCSLVRFPAHYCGCHYSLTRIPRSLQRISLFTNADINVPYCDYHSSLMRFPCSPQRISLFTNADVSVPNCRHQSSPPRISMFTADINVPYCGY